MNKTGFTLMEVLVALIIFSLIFLPLTGIFVAESRFKKTYENKMVALLVAKNEIEKNKRSKSALEDKEYFLTMGGRAWRITRTIEKKSGSFSGQEEVSSIGTIAAGRPAGSEEVFITIQVGRENDSITLASLKVQKETY